MIDPAFSATCAKAARVFCAIGMMLVLALFALLPSPARAQTSYTYTQASDGAVGSTRPCSDPLVRNFVVGDNFSIADVDIGIYATHTWRGDLRFVLQSPAGTRVQLTNGDTGSMNGNNFNVLLDDSAAQEVGSDSPTGNHPTGTPPPYANTFRPNNPLSAFNGENAAGTWRLEACDLLPQFDDGTFRHATLYLTAALTNYADLSLSKTLIGNAPVSGGAAVWRLAVTNSASSPDTATGVIITDNLPLGVTFASASGSGTYSAANAEWNVGNLAPGQTKTIDITVVADATAGALITNTAEITASSETDPDSTVDNGSSAEDDYASSSFTVAGTRSAGIPPVLSCPAGTSLFDWDNISWADGSTSNSYSVTDIGSVDFDITTNGTWVFDNGFGGQSPTVDDANTGGFPGSQVSLHQYLDFDDIFETATTTITLPVSVPGLQFTVLDIDYAFNDFADKLTVYGTNGGATVYPVLTNGVTNYVTGNVAIGDAGTNGLDADGNVVVTFDQAVDTIIIEYGNHSTAPTVPDGQAIAIHDITFCKPSVTLGVTKISSVISDPVNGTSNPLAIPGAVIEYCITISNDTSTTVTNVVAADDLPSTLVYATASMTSGSSCADASTPEDDDASGSDESDPIGASFAAGTLTASTASLGPSGALAIKFRATIN